MGNATLPGTQVGPMHALRDLMFDTTLNPWALPTIVQATASHCWGLLARAGHSLGLGTFRYSKHDFLPGCSLGPQKMPHPGLTSWGIGHALLPSPCLPHLQDGPHLQRPVVKSKASVSPFHVFPHSHWVPVSAREASSQG